MNDNLMTTSTRNPQRDSICDLKSTIRQTAGGQVYNLLSAYFSNSSLTATPIFSNKNGFLIYAPAPRR